ncbi:MAG TPA: Gfo/Idh/MocA family oxidoreductase [Chitinispirillaceae bacterium]|nr:Gfo/Idh/MocA family oxidoreductase [Chitinispirillaceae bacterium]
MAKKVIFGIIGAGMIGDRHIESLQSSENVYIKSIASQTLETNRKKCAKYNIEHGTVDYKEILDDPQIDAVVIATPPYLHKQIVLDALDANKHILLEKPMVTTPHDMEIVCDAAKNKPECVVVECSCRHSRLQPKFRVIKQMIDNGALGEIYHIHHSHLTRGTFIEYNPAGTWMLDKTMSGGGPFMDWGPYDLSFHLGLLNDMPELVSVQSFKRNGLKAFKDPSIRQDIEEHGGAFLKFNNGLTYYYERGAGVHCEQKNETKIFGTKGCLRFGYLTWDQADIEFFYNDPLKGDQHDVFTVDMTSHTDDHLELIKHFINCISNNEKPAMTPQLASKHLSIVFKILNEK